MRLLFVSHSFPLPRRPLSNLGGMQRVATELHAALARHPGVTLSSVLLHTSWRWTHVLTGPFLAKAYWRIRRLAREEAVDGVLFSSMVSGALALRLQRALAPRGIPLAAIAHGRDVTLPLAPYQRVVPRIFAALDAVLPVSRATGEACLARGLDRDKLHVVPNGVDAGRFAPRPEGGAARRALLEALGPLAGPLPPGAFLLCSVGRQVPRKGFAWFVDAVMPLLPPDVHYWMAGDGPEAEAIAAAVAQRGLGGRVRLLGRLSEEHLRLLYGGADLFVMPNIPVPGDMEGFGVVMLEAGLSGLPTVASRLEGILDVVAEGENGRLVESGDARAFAEAILASYRDRAALADASRRAAAYTAATFGWPAVADRYVEVMDALRTRVAVS